jgi:hypothetical protein
MKPILDRPLSPFTMIIDLEVLPGDAVEGMDLDHAPGWDPPMPVVEARQPPGNYKDPEKIQAWLAKEQLRQIAAAHKELDAQRAKDLKHWRDGALRPADARIACIGYAFGEEEPATIDCAEDEEAGLKELSSLVADRSPSRIVAHNGAGYDFPMVQIRAMRWRGFWLAGRFHQDKPWDKRMVDTFLWWPGGRWDKGRNLTACADLLGISREGNPIDGAQVLDSYVAGRWHEVVDHCLDDIAVLREVYRALREVRGE